MKRYIITIIVILTVGNIKGQSESFINRIPEFPKIETPNAAAFNKFIDNPINIYNGTPDVNVPIYTLNDGQIELPIVMRYNTSGIKVEEEASWVGLGWNLNVGGVITKSVVGDPDEYNSGSEYEYIFKRLNLENPYLSYIYPQITADFYNKLSVYLENPGLRVYGKMQPDVYYFSYPGGGGKFIIDHRNDSLIILNRESDLRISRETGIAYDFKITTTEGIQHCFKKHSSTYPRTMKTRPVSTNYVLSNTIYPNGQIIKYDYITKTYEGSSYSESYQTILAATPFYGARGHYNPGGKNAPQSGNVEYMDGNEFLLKEITTTNYSIIFDVSPRTDIHHGQKLDYIKIKPRNGGDKQGKIYAFIYDYFKGAKVGKSKISHRCNSSSLPNSLSYDRLRLNSIYQIGDNSTKNDKYSFYYNTETLPQKDSYAADFWGYYNGEINNVTFIPDLRYLRWGQSDLADDIPNFYKAKRISNEKYCRAGMLEKIQYPTGGMCEVAYEANSFRGHFIPTSNDVGSLSISITAKDMNGKNDKKTQTFTIDEAVTVDFSCYASTGLNGWDDIKFHTIELYKEEGGKSTLIKDYNLTMECQNMFLATLKNQSAPKNGSVSNTTTRYFSPGTYTIRVDLPDKLGEQNGASLKNGSVGATVSYNRRPKIGNQSQGCGLRVKSINLYESSDKSKLLSSTTYDYTDPRTKLTSGVIHEIPLYYTIYNGCRYEFKISNTNIAIPPGTDNGKWPGTFSCYFNVAEIHGNNVVNSPYSSIAGVGYSQVKETKLGTIGNGYTIHYFYNKEPQIANDKGQTNTSLRIDDPLNGKLETKEQYSQTNTLIQQEKFKYQKKTSHNYWGMHIIDYMNKFPMIFNFSGSFNLIPGGVILGSDRYYNENMTVRARMILHSLNSYDILLTNKETTIDGITSKEEYSYKPTTLQLSEKKIILEDGNHLKYSYRYPNDFNCGIYSEMNKVNMISLPVEERIFRSDFYIGGKVIEYKLNRDKKIISPSILHFSEVKDKIKSPQTFSCTGVNKTIFPMENVKYFEYDSFGNPIYLTHNDASKLVYLWSYNGQYPIAEIQNATYDEVKTALGGVLPESLSTSLEPNAALMKRLRDNLKEAHVSTYTYKPLVGILTATNPAGITTYYDYDTFGRLKRTYIRENGVDKDVQTYDYNYKNK